MPSLTADIPSQFFYDLGQMVARMRAKGARITGEDLLAVWNWESGINPAIQNRGGAPYYGINQMGISEMKGAGFTGTPEQWMALSHVEQLKYIDRFIQQKVAGSLGGRWDMLNGGAEFYLLNWLGALLPRVYQDPDATIVARQNTPELLAKYPQANTWYSANAGLDASGDGRITLNDLQATIAKSKGSKRYQEAVQRYIEESGQPPAPSGNLLAIAFPATFSWKPLIALALLGGAGYILTRKNPPSLPSLSDLNPRRLVRRFT